MIDTMDIVPFSDILHNEGYSAISLEGYLAVAVGKTYTFCLTSNDRAKLYINDKLKFVMNDGQIETMKCEDITALHKVLKVSVHGFGTKGGTYRPLVLRWKTPNEPNLSIVPSNAWIEVSHTR